MFKLLLKTVFVVLIFFGGVASCGTRAYERPTEAQMTTAMAEANKMGEVRRAFAKDHPYKNANSRAYIEGLKKEGFDCRIQYRDRAFYSDGKDGKPFGILSRQEPSVSCEREPSGFAECAWFRVGITVGWSDLNAPFTALATQLPTSLVTDATFICHAQPPDPQYKTSITEGIRKGEVLVIK